MGSETLSGCASSSIRVNLQIVPWGRLVKGVQGGTPRRDPKSYSPICLGMFALILTVLHGDYCTYPMKDC